jgi:hypothetical protein
MPSFVGPVWAIEDETPEMETTAHLKVLVDGQRQSPVLPRPKLATYRSVRPNRAGSVSSKRGDERESAPVTRVSSSSTMFATVDSSNATPDAKYVGSRITALTRPPGRKASIDAGLNTASPIDGPRRDIL